MIDPELAAMIDLLPSIDLSDPVAARQAFEQILVAIEVDIPGWRPSGSTTGSCRGGRATPTLQSASTVPGRPASPVPGIVMIHGGGFVIGSVEAEHAGAALMAIDSGAVVVSVEYRLAPEHPYPAGLHDCYAALAFLHAEAGALGVDPGRVALCGASAGGGLAAATALLARDLGGPPVCFQMLHIPELDDRLETPSMRAFVDSPLWNRPLAVQSWKAYLGDLSGAADVPPYAAPARADRPLGAAAGLRLDGGERPAARRGDHLRAPAAPGRGVGGAAPVPRHVPRLGAGHDGRRLPARPT